MGFREFVKEFYGEFVNYINCLPSKDKEEREFLHTDKDWNLWENKNFNDSYENIPPPSFPKLPQHTRKSDFSRYLL